MLPDPEVGAGAIRRLEQDVQRAIELVTGPIEVAERQLLLAGLEVPVRARQEGQGRILHDSGLRRGRGNRCGCWWCDLRNLRRVAGSASSYEQGEAGGDEWSKHLGGYTPIS